MAVWWPLIRGLTAHLVLSAEFDMKKQTILASSRDRTSGGGSYQMTNARTTSVLSTVTNEFPKPPVQRIEGLAPLQGISLFQQI